MAPSYYPAVARPGVSGRVPRKAPSGTVEHWMVWPLTGEEILRPTSPLARQVFKIDAFGHYGDELGSIEVLSPAHQSALLNQITKPAPFSWYHAA